MNPARTPGMPTELRDSGKPRDHARRPVWLEATESFYKKLNRIANQCGLSRYEALSRGLDALRREIALRNSPLNRTIKSAAQSEVFRRTMGQVSRNYWATISTEKKRERAPGHAGDRHCGGPENADADIRSLVNGPADFPIRSRAHCNDQSPTIDDIRMGEPRPFAMSTVQCGELDKMILFGVTLAVHSNCWNLFQTPAKT
jgi:hypothetical protein